jgi:hypothetical protein
MPAFDDHLRLRAEQRGRPQHEVGELRTPRTPQGRIAPNEQRA